MLLPLSHPIIRHCSFFLLCYNVAMTTLTVDDLQHDVLRFLQLGEASETLLIIQVGTLVTGLRPIAREMEALSRSRPAGLCARELTVADDFDALLSADILDAFAPINS